MILAIVTLISLTISANAQNTIKGKIQTDDKSPLEYANVVLLSLPDSTFIGGVVSESDGSFVLDCGNANYNQRLVKISSIGYATIYKQAQADMGILTMKGEENQLSEVVVKSELPKMQMKGDAMVTHVEGSVLEKAGTTINLLDKIPSVSASNGSVEVFGRGAAEIYVNGRKLNGYSELEQIPSDNIASVEVVNNPGARYQASTRAVIRIKTKKPLGDGFSFSDIANIGYKYDWLYSDQVDANYRKGGLDVGGRVIAAHNNEGMKQISTQDTYFNEGGKQNVYSQVNDTKTDSNGNPLTAMAQINYITKKQSSMGVRYEHQQTNNSKDNCDFLTDIFINGKMAEHSDSYIYGEADNRSNSVNLYYIGNIKGWGLTWNGDGFWNKNTSMSISKEDVKNTETGEQTHRDVKTGTESSNDLLATKLILDHALWGGRVSFGGEYSSNVRHSDYVGAKGITDDDMSKVDEKIASGFVEYQHKIGKIDANIGLRYENVVSNYYLFGKKQDEMSRTYGDLFPSVSLSTILGGKVWTQLSFSNDITRPMYQYLTSSVTYLNRYTYDSGNPALKPTYQRNLVFNASYKTFFASIGYQHIKDAVSVTITPYADDPTINCQRPTNMNAYDHLYLVMNYRPNVGQKWHPSFTANAGYQTYEAEFCGAMKKFDRPLFNFIWNNNLQLPAGILLDADLVLITPGDQMNTRINHSIFQAQATLQRDFLKKRLNCRLNIVDPFQTMGVKAKVYSGNNKTGVDNVSRRQVTLTLTYRFNQAQDKYRGTGAGQSMKERM